MKAKSLLETNPYMKDKEESRRLIFNSVASSSAIEGVRIKKGDGSWAVLTERKSTPARSATSKTASARRRK